MMKQDLKVIKTYLKVIKAIHNKVILKQLFVTIGLKIKIPKQKLFRDFIIYAFTGSATSTGNEIWF